MIVVEKIDDRIPVGTRTVSGVIESDIQSVEREYRPSIFSVHIFSFMEENKIFVQNGVKYMRCFGETIECDDYLKKYTKSETFTAPDYRDKILKHVSKEEPKNNIRTITKKHMPEHDHEVKINQPIKHNIGNKEGVGGHDEDTRDVWIDIVFTKGKKLINIDDPDSEQNIDVSDSSLGVIFAIVIGYE